MDKTEVKKLFLIINSCYQNFSIDDVKTEVWLSFLKEFPFDRAQKNLHEHIKTNKFVPTPADIIQYDPLGMEMELIELKESREEAFFEFTLRGGDGEKFDSSPWDKEIKELENLLPPKKPGPFERFRDKEIRARNRDIAHLRWTEDGHDPANFDFSKTY